MRHEDILPSQDERIEDEVITNHSGNETFQSIAARRLSRRSVVKGGLTTAAAFMTPSLMANTLGEFKPELVSPKFRAPLMDFQPVTLADAAASDGRVPLISPDYEYQTLIPWGTPLKAGIPEYDGDPDRRPTADEQAFQVGIGHDGMWLFPETAGRRRSNTRGVLCINHEFGRNSHVTGKSGPENLEDVRLSQHAHGVSVVAIEESGGTWEVVPDTRNRRVHVNTPVTFSGPVADSPVGQALLQLDRGETRGTVNNCSSGKTPWGTYLTCEENFNGYFGNAYVQALFPAILRTVTADNPGASEQEIAGLVNARLNEIFSGFATEEQLRYGFSVAGFGYGWERFDERFDLSQQNGEDNRFGWVVEIDPQDGSQVPVKRTALGRFKHEGAELTVGRGGRVVVYMGDDQRFDYIYKYVSDDNWRSMIAKGVSPLDEGKLYVARFYEGGVGEWLELTIDNPTLARRFEDQAEVLTYARVAADLLGATPMDRPEWTSVAPDGYCYCTLTNNSRRTEADAANPLAPNSDGHIIRWRDTDQFVGTVFEWDIFLFAEDTHGTEESFSDPDGIWADPDGRLFIETDGGQKDGLQNQLLVSNTNTGEIRRLLTGVNGDEITGLTVTPDRETMFVNTQHPGNGNPELTNFPAEDGSGRIPRDCTFVIRRKGGGVVGT
ncbi:MAG: PhoX family phosphatase [Xanthomonadales bacterium]|jgi:secreted PhoX family phosphatase|nr:PhoX family phosphatase [Xanthomonadales bacterium]